MRVDDIRVERLGDRVELSARVSSSALEQPLRLWFRFPREVARYISDVGDPFLAATLMPSMALGERVEIAAPVSATLVRHADRLMEVYSAWWPELARVPVKTGRPPLGPRWSLRRRASACFFSMGVDSYYTLFKNADGSSYGVRPIESLVWVTGFDIRQENDELLRAVEERLVAASAALGKPLLRIETNIRRLSDPFVSWVKFHGSAMAAVGLALDGLFSTVYIAATYGYDHFEPWGSHPLSDPLWSSDRVRFIHDGAELARPNKTALIAEEPIVQQTLRTCWENRGNDYNCGECEKCLRTMVVLESVGVLESMRTYPATVSLEALAGLQWSDPVTRQRFTEILRAIPDDDRTRSVRDAIERHLAAGLPLAE